MYKYKQLYISSRHRPPQESDDTIKEMATNIFFELQSFAFGLHRGLNNDTFGLSPFPCYCPSTANISKQTSPTFPKPQNAGRRSESPSLRPFLQDAFASTDSSPFSAKPSSKPSKHSTISAPPLPARSKPPFPSRNLSARSASSRSDAYSRRSGA